jgi:hypothetical protein
MFAVVQGEARGTYIGRAVAFLSDNYLQVTQGALMVLVKVWYGKFWL